MNNKDRKEQGHVYYYDDPTLYNGQIEYQELLYVYNLLRPTQVEQKQQLLKKMFFEIGDNFNDLSMIKVAG